MNMRDALKMMDQSHIWDAVQEFRENGLDWILNQTGRREPRTEHLIIAGGFYPLKAIGYRAAQHAGGLLGTDDNPTTNEVFNALKKFGYERYSGQADLAIVRQEMLHDAAYREVLARPQQGAFRKAVLGSYDGQCAISGCDVPSALEAAHVKPFVDGGSNSAANGILLRCDLHKMFDLGLLALNPTNCTVTLSNRIAEYYHDFSGVKINLPKTGPSISVFAGRWSTFQGRYG